MFLSVHFAKTEEVVHDLTLSSLLVCCPQVQQTVNFRQTTLNKKHTVLDYAFDLDYLTVCFTREAVCLVLWLYPLVKTTENLTKAERLRTVVRQESDLFIINGVWTELEGNMKSLTAWSQQCHQLPKTSTWRRPTHSTHLSDWTGGSQWQPNTFNHWAPPAGLHPERNPSHPSESSSQCRCFVSSTFVYHDL